jgi:hypothetical protein
MHSIHDLESFRSIPYHDRLAPIITGETGESSAGFPTISEASFQKWMTEVPHLFLDGAALLDGLHALQNVIQIAEQPDESLRGSWLRAIKVLETVIQTGAVTAPSDLWLMKHILSSHFKTGILKTLQDKGQVSLQDLSQSLGLNFNQLRYDFHFLKSRGFVEGGTDQEAYSISPLPHVQALLHEFTPLEGTWPVNMIPLLKRCFAGEELDAQCSKELKAFLTLPGGLKAAPNWIPGRLEVEVGYRLVPMILAYRNSPLYAASPTNMVPNSLPFAVEIKSCLKQAGIVNAAGLLTALGTRVLERGPGPFGIIHAYHEYMGKHESLLRGLESHAWVSRGENVAASQDANKKTFQMINAGLDRFVERTGFQLKVFIEHAVGQGEATKQRFAKSGQDAIQYFGADLEDAAIDQAMAAQKRGELPSNMRFIRRADIGDPSYLFLKLGEFGVSPHGSVMVVGNGFHEIRAQTNQKMIEVFKAYNEAGILLIFTEESALSDEDLVHTGWNTYHAGFRYVHEISGQGLRPAYDYDAETDRLSWRQCLERAGYWVHPGYTSQTRRIYPVPRANGYNPAISVNYFCIPTDLATSLRSKAFS